MEQQRGRSATVAEPGPPATIEADEERQEAEDWAEIDRLRARNADQDPDQVMRDVTEAVEEVRREMYDEERRAAAGGG